MSESDKDKDGETYVGEVLARVRTTRLLAGGGGDNCLHCVGEQVAELESLDQVADSPNVRIHPG